MPLKLRRRRTFGKSVAWACTDYWYQFSGKDVPNEFRGAHKMWHKCAVSGTSPWQWNGTIERCSKLHSTTCTEQDCPSLLTSVCTQNDVMLILNTQYLLTKYSDIGFNRNTSQEFFLYHSLGQPLPSDLRGTEIWDRNSGSKNERNAHYKIYRISIEFLWKYSCLA